MLYGEYFIISCRWSSRIASKPDVKNGFFVLRFRSQTCCLGYQTTRGRAWGLAEPGRGMRSQHSIRKLTSEEKGWIRIAIHVFFSAYSRRCFEPQMETQFFTDAWKTSFCGAEGKPNKKHAYLGGDEKKKWFVFLPNWGKWFRSSGVPSRFLSCPYS